MGFKYRRLLFSSASFLVVSSAIASTGVIVAHAAAPAVTSVTPISGSTEGGDGPIIIAGSGFTGATSVQFSVNAKVTSQPCPPAPPVPAAGCFTFISDTEIHAFTPAHKQATVDVTVTTPAGTSAINNPGDHFTYNAPTPQPAVLDVHAGPGGTTINISPLNGQAELSGYDFATSVDFVPSSGPTVPVTNTPCAGSTGPNGCYDIQGDLIRLEAPSTGWLAGTPYDVTVTTAGGTSAVHPATDQFTFTAGNVYQVPANAPFRVFDTRSNGQHLTAGRTDFVQVVGVDGVPPSATAVVVNVTATGGTASSFFTVFPGGNPRPLASNLNFVAHQTVANLVTVPIGSGGVDVFNLAGTSDAVVDLEGYFFPSPGAAGTYHPLTPARITDTRAGSGQTNAGHRLGANSTLFVPVNGAGGVPPSGVSAVVLNVTAVGPSGSSFLTVFRHGAGLPLASNLNFTPGQVVPNRVVVPVASGGVDIYNQQGSVDVVVDTGGWFSDSSGATGFTFTPLANPTRIADTRPNSGQPLAGQTLGARDTRTVLVTTPLSLPGGTQAVAANVTVTNTSGPSFLTVFPTGFPQPLASDLNWVRGQTVPNLAITQLGSGGDLNVYNNTFSVDVIVDVFGYWS